MAAFWIVFVVLVFFCIACAIVIINLLSHDWDEDR